MIEEDELSKDLLTFLNNTLQRTVDLLNDLLLNDQNLKGQPKVTVEPSMIKQMSALIQEEVRVLPENNMQPLQDAEFKQTQIEKIMTAALLTCQTLSTQGITKVTDDQAKSTFKTALIKVNTIQSKNTIKIGTHRSKPITPKPVKRVPINLKDLIDPVPRKLINLKDLIDPVPHTPVPRKPIDLSKVVLAAMVAIGTAAPAAGAGMVGEHLVNKHKEKIPTPLKKGKTGAAVKVVGVAGAVAAPAVLAGVVLESSRKGIITRLNKVANDLKDSSKTSPATQKSPMKFAKTNPQKEKSIKNNPQTTLKSIKPKILSRFKKK